MVNRVLGILVLAVLAFGCTKDLSPQAVVYGKDSCADCHMTISDHRFGAQIITKNGKIMHFDSVNCMHHYLKSKNEVTAKIYFADSLHKGEWIPAEKAQFGIIENLRSPMGAGIISVHAVGELANWPGFSESTKAQGIKGSLQWDQLSAELSSGKYR